MSLFQFEQPPPRPYYHNPYVGTLATLMAQPTQIEADRVLRSSQIGAQMTDSIANAASGTLNSLMRYQMDEPRRRLEGAQASLAESKVKELKDQQAEQDLIKSAFADNGGDMESTLSDLRTRGAIGVSAATKLQKQVDETRKADLQAQTDQLKLAGQRLTQASQFLTSVQNLPEEQRPDGYARVLPQVRSIVGDKLGALLPDKYDPNVVDQAITMGEDAKTTLDRRKAALDTAREGREKAKDAREADAYNTKSLGQWLPTVASQQEWTNALAFAKQHGASDATLAKFGPEFSPEAVKRAETFAVTPEEKLKNDQGAKLGTFEDFVGSYAKDTLKKPTATLTAQDRLNAAKAWAQAHKTDNSSDLTASKRQDLVATIIQYPSVYNDLTDTVKSAIAPDLAKAGFSAFGAPSTATRAAAERWRASEVARARADVTLAEKPDQLKEVLDTIEASYRAQVGGAGGPAPRTAPAPVVTPGVAPAAPGAKPATPAAAPAPKGTSAPPAVMQVLRGQKPGKYTLTDGTKWIVGADGAITPGS